MNLECCLFKVTVALLKSTPQKVNKTNSFQQFGSLSALFFKSEELDNTVASPDGENKSSLPDKQLIDDPQIILNITCNTKYGNLKRLTCVFCLSDEQIWISSFEEHISRLYNLQGNQVESIQTKSGKVTNDIAVTRSGYLVYMYTECLRPQSV